MTYHEERCFRLDLGGIFLALIVLIVVAIFGSPLSSLHFLRRIRQRRQRGQHGCLRRRARCQQRQQVCCPKAPPTTAGGRCSSAREVVAQSRSRASKIMEAWAAWHQSCTSAPKGSCKCKRVKPRPIGDVRLRTWSGSEESELRKVAGHLAARCRAVKQPSLGRELGFRRKLKYASPDRPLTF